MPRFILMPFQLFIIANIGGVSYSEMQSPSTSGEM